MVKKSVLVIWLLAGRKPIRVKEHENWLEISVRGVGSSASHKKQNAQ